MSSRKSLIGGGLISRLLEFPPGFFLFFVFFVFEDAGAGSKRFSQREGNSGNFEFGFLTFQNSTLFLVYSKSE